MRCFSFHCKFLKKNWQHASTCWYLSLIYQLLSIAELLISTCILMNINFAHQLGNKIDENKYSSNIDDTSLFVFFFFWQIGPNTSVWTMKVNFWLKFQNNIFIFDKYMRGMSNVFCNCLFIGYSKAVINHKFDFAKINFFIKNQDYRV